MTIRDRIIENTSSLIDSLIEASIGAVFYN